VTPALKFEVGLHKLFLFKYLDLIYESTTSPFASFALKTRVHARTPLPAFPGKLDESEFQEMRSANASGRLIVQIRFVLDHPGRVDCHKTGRN
jgi:hypothetical protein